MFPVGSFINQGHHPAEKGVDNDRFVSSHESILSSMIVVPLGDSIGYKRRDRYGTGHCSPHAKDRDIRTHGKCIYVTQELSCFTLLIDMEYPPC